MSNKTVTQNGMTVPHVILIITSIGMIASSIYLLAHFLQTFYPVGFDSVQLCNMHGFFSCDAVVYSPISSFFKIPISLLGLWAGSILLFSSLFPSENRESTNRILSIINASGCLILFIYSLVFIRSLCPGCTLYYIFSITNAVIFYKYSSLKKFEIKTLASYLVVFIIAIGIFLTLTHSRENKIASLKTQLIEQFYSYQNLGSPKNESQFRIVSSSENFEDAPIKMTIFSDFECPACKALADNLPRIFERYKGKLNIQFYFYPLDNNCNPNMQGPMHQNACKASYLAACLPKKFSNFHDILFANVANFSDRWFSEVAKDENVEECYNSPATKQLVVDMIREADMFNLRSTPTMIINGVKIEGVLHSTHLIMILDEIVRRATNDK